MSVTKKSGIGFSKDDEVDRRPNLNIVFFSKAVFTLGRNMISLITNETCFVMKSVHIRKFIERIMVET